MITEYLNKDTAENILQHLQKYTLDPSFEDYGDFVNSNPTWLTPGNARKYAGCTMIFGNFLNFSHVFRIITDDPALIECISKSIIRNKATPEYQAARARMIETRKQKRKERERLIALYGNYIGYEKPC